MYYDKMVSPHTKKNVLALIWPLIEKFRERERERAVKGAMSELRQRAGEL